MKALLKKAGMKSRNALALRAGIGAIGGGLIGNKVSKAKGDSKEQQTKTTGASALAGGLAGMAGAHKLAKPVAKGVGKGADKTVKTLHKHRDLFTD